MQINISGHQVEVTPALHQYATSKLQRVVRHFDHLHDISIILSVEKLVHKAEATLHCPVNKTIYADAEAEDMYAAIDALADRLDRQVRKLKGKLTDHHRDDVRQARYV